MKCDKYLLYVTQERAWDYLKNMGSVWWHGPTEMSIQRQDFQMSSPEFLDKTNSLQVSRAPRETSKRHWANKGQQKRRNSTQGRYFHVHGWVESSSLLVLQQRVVKCFFFLCQPEGSGLKKVKRSQPGRKSRISLIGYQSITLYTGAMLQTLLWQKLKVSVWYKLAF